MGVETERLGAGRAAERSLARGRAKTVMVALALGVSAASCAATAARRAPWAALPDPAGLERATLGDGTASLRGLSAVSADVAWATGSGPTVAVTTDGGEVWLDVAPDSIEGLDVRDVHAVSGDVAWILTSGLGEASRILATRDGGATWVEQHREVESKSFLDGFAFFDGRNAIAYGDPLPRRGFRILRTDDGGASWVPCEPGPLPLESGEASFAASGTGIVAWRSADPVSVRAVSVVTGANDANARVFTTATYSQKVGPFDLGSSWSVAETTLPAPKPASGAFSLAVTDAGLIAVGGDYTARDVGGTHCASWSEDGVHWNEPDVGPRGQRAGCCALPLLGGFVATGQTGTDVTLDGGRTWAPFFDDGYHCVEASRDGAALWFAGPNGRVARLLAP